MNESPNIITGDFHEDERGKLIFFNKLDLSLVKRFYIIVHRDIEIVRAWQGHKQEQKWFYLLKGAFTVVLLRPDNWQDPSADLPLEKFVLQNGVQEVLHVPGGYANGLKALEPNSEIMVFSSFTVEESSKDNFRFDRDKWFDWNKS